MGARQPPIPCPTEGCLVTSWTLSYRHFSKTYCRKPASPPRSGASQRPWARGPRPSAAWRFALTGGLAGPRAWPTAHGAREPARRWALRGPPLAPSAGGRGSPAPRRRSAVGPPAGAPPTTPALVSATAALWPAREALGTPALAAWRGVAASPRRARGPAWPPKGPGWCRVGAGWAAGVGPRPCPGGARIPRPGGATWEGVRARCRDVLPRTLRASEVGSWPGRPLARSRDVCGGACRAPGVTGCPRRLHAANGSSPSSRVSIGSTNSRYGYKRWVSFSMRYRMKSSQSPLR
jgi:hypothetical protein